MQDGKVTQAYTHPLRSMSVPDLCFAADQVREVMEHPGWKLVAACIGEAAARKTAQIVDNPSIKSLEEYAAVTAEIRGMQSMQAAAQTILKFAADREREATTAQEATA